MSGNGNSLYTDKKDRTMEYIAYACLFVFAIFVSIHACIAYDLMIRAGQEGDVITAIANAFSRLETSPFDLYFTSYTLKGVGFTALCMAIAGISWFSVERKTRFGKEHGSAGYATRKDVLKFTDESDDDRNMLFAKDVYFSLNTRKTRRNNNIVIVGGSGSGKTRFFAKPNIMQAHTSYVCTDPKGELLRSTGKLLEDEGYVIRVFNLIETDHSDCYNPFHYIHKESDIFKLINQLIKSTNPKESSGSSDPFWEKSEQLLLESCMLYLWYMCPKEEQNFKSVMDLIRIADASEEDENQKSRLDILFENLAKEKGETFLPVRQYNIYKKASGKTAKSILISVGARLQTFNLPEVENITITDTLHLDEIGDRKTALYIVISDADGSLNFLASLLYTQLFDSLYFKADFGELEWKNDHILYRSPESLVVKRDKLKALYQEYTTTIGELKKEDLFHEILDLLDQIEDEFGLISPKIGKKITKKFIDTHVDNINSQLLRLRDRSITLHKYCGDLETIHKSLKTLYKKNKLNRFTYETPKLKNMTPFERKEIDVLVDLFKIEMRLHKEFGLELPSHTEKVMGIFNRPITSKQRIKLVAKLIKSANGLLLEMENSEVLYGTRESFEDKRTKLTLLSEEIAKKEKLITELSKRQTAEREKIKKDIVKIKEQMHNIELIAKYEFGIDDLTKRHRNGGRLPTHVRCILDEFANISPIPDFSKLVATMRSREISVNIILQNQSQLKAMYEKEWESIIGNCDTYIFLGGQEQSTTETISKRLGKETIDKRSQGTSKGRQGSSSENWDTLGRELLFDFEVGQLPNDECIIFIRGAKPIRAKKYPLEEHPRYKLLGEPDNPSDPRLYDFYSKFNTVKTAKGVDHRRLLMDGEYKKILTERITEYIDRLDMRKTFETISTKDSMLLMRNNIEGFTASRFEKEKEEFKDAVIRKNVILEIEKRLRDKEVDLEMTGAYDRLRNVTTKDISSVLTLSLQAFTGMDETQTETTEETKATLYNESRESAQESISRIEEAKQEKVAENKKQETPEPADSSSSSGNLQDNLDGSLDTMPPSDSIINANAQTKSEDTQEQEGALEKMEQDKPLEKEVSSASEEEKETSSVVSYDFKTAQKVQKAGTIDDMVSFFTKETDEKETQDQTTIPSSENEEEEVKEEETSMESFEEPDNNSEETVLDSNKETEVDYGVSSLSDSDSMDEFGFLHAETSAIDDIEEDVEVSEDDEDDMGYEEE